MAHTDLGHGFYTFHVNEEEDPPYDAAPGTDFAALADGAVSLTPLSFAWGEPDVFRETRSWTAAAAQGIDHDLGSPRLVDGPAFPTSAGSDHRGARPDGPESMEEHR